MNPWCALSAGRRTTWSRTETGCVAPENTGRTPSQALEFSTPLPDSPSHLAARSVKERKAYTAGPLRTSALPSALPSFLEACAELVGQAILRDEFDRARHLIEQAEGAASTTSGGAAA
jgi:hypothetical protein